jgi:nondiscriminating glutamyl-tRNA synthetase
MSSSVSDIRVRIAPSPTGFLHVGTARTALFNYLFAKGHGGKFILRIEDTDLERSQAHYTQNIFDSLHLLGLNWDEGPGIGGDYGPYEQSNRLDLYREWADKLVQSDHAYLCYHTQAELDAQREAAQAEKRAYIYNGACRNNNAKALAKTPTADGSARQPSLRFKIPDNRGELTFQDAVRGAVTFDTALIGDFVLMKSDGTPSYNFAVVVDDILMRISHIIRGEDHLSNTPRQALLYEAFGVTPPTFAHVGMILAPDRTKLSKRHGAVAVSDYIGQGYFPEAFCNFLTLLGWSPPDGQELGDLAQFASQFELERITHSPAIFELDKLNFINGRLIRSLPLDELLSRAEPFLKALDLSRYSPEQLQMMLDIVREPLQTLGELPEALAYFVGDIVAFEKAEEAEGLHEEEPQQVLAAFQRDLLSRADFFESPESISATLKPWAQSLKPIKPKVVWGSLRLSMTGRMHGADLAKTLFLLGKETAQKRVEAILALPAIR